jgi:hypothetical protein
VQGYGALLTWAHLLRETVQAYRASEGSWPKEAEAWANSEEDYWMGGFEYAATLDVTDELQAFTERNQLDWDREVFRKIECRPVTNKKVVIVFELADSTRIELHGVPVTKGTVEVESARDWVVEVDRFNGPRIRKMTAKRGQTSSDITDLLACWGMIRIYPNQGHRVVWVSTKTLACTIHLLGEIVDKVSCQEIPTSWRD